jgi:diguanylate cyclase (GGDEF)-like protein
MELRTESSKLMTITPRRARRGSRRRCAAWLKELAQLSLEEHEAAELWNDLIAHKAQMSAKLGRDVGWQVALLDHLQNISPNRGQVEVIAVPALERLQQHALVDRLTGLYNRAYFDAQFTRECERHRRYDTNAALMLLDLDRFKEVNDATGHRGGDDVLRAVSGIVRECLRAADMPFRFGGDELAALLTDADAAEALHVAERVRAGIADGFRLFSVPVTASIGLAMLRHCAPARMEDDVFERADRALYTAKRAGGDQVVQDDAPTPHPDNFADGHARTGATVALNVHSRE